MRKYIIILFTLCAALAVHAQDRSKLSVYVPLPEGGTAQQKEYFQTNFKMELIGANYPSVETRAESAYTLFLTISDNPDFVPTAAREGVTSWDDNQLKPFELGIKLVHSDNEEEVVSFSFLFDTLESMNEWNLYLLYQALANAYVPPDPVGVTITLDAPPSNELWRNLTFYLNLAAGIDSGHLQSRETGKNRMGVVMPAVFAGLEWHFLPYLSLELDPVKLRMLNDKSALVMALAVPFVVKGVFKPGGVMLEPYAGLEGNFAFWDQREIPLLSVLGGVQLGFQAGRRSAWTIDVGITRNITGAYELDGSLYDVLRVHVMAGWKFGFKARPEADEEE
jgi:hypothetical protein